MQFMIKDPRRQATAGIRCWRPVNLIDIYPTICSLAGLSLPDQGITGHDLTPLLDNPTTPWPVPALTTFKTVRENAIRTERHSYIRYNDDTSNTELYDLLHDPDETRNLAIQPNQGSLKIQLNDLLNQAMAEANFRQ